MEEPKDSLFVKSLVDVFILTFLFAIAVSFFRYYHQKDYDYLVEAACDPNTELCFSRDCENSDDCPPNQLSVYKEYRVKAYSFPHCEDDSCEVACTSGSIECRIVQCDETVGDMCMGPE